MIELRRGRTATIDDEDWPLVAGYKWHAREDRSSGKHRHYAHTNVSKTATSPRTKLLLHRLIMDARPGEQVDHVSGDGLDCRRKNLRLATGSQNAGNSGSFTGTSRHKGVSWVKEKGAWRAAIYHRGHTRFFGYFADECEAAAAYNREALRLHGKFAQHNEV